MISEKHKAIFIHIPKAAGTSIERKFGFYDVPRPEKQDHRSLRWIRPLSVLKHGKFLLDPEPLRAESDTWLSRKTILREMLGIKIASSRHGARASARQWQTYYKFTVVRNPWGRVYSWYQNVMRDTMHGIPNCSFKEFLLQHSDNWALKPQTYWISDFDDSIPLDRVVRFENLAEEMSELLSDLGFSDTTLPHALKSSDQNGYRSAFDEETKRIVAQRYEREIELFGYEF